MSGINTGSRGDAKSHSSMANERAADALDALAKRFPPGHGNRKRVAAYRNAAESLRTTEHDIVDLWKRGDGRALTTISGVTPAIAQMLAELIASKRLLLTDPVREDEEDDV